VGIEQDCRSFWKSWPVQLLVNLVRISLRAAVKFRSTLFAFGRSNSLNPLRTLLGGCAVRIFTLRRIARIVICLFIYIRTIQMGRISTREDYFL